MSEGVVAVQVVVEVAELLHLAELVVGVGVAGVVRAARELVHVVLLGLRDLDHHPFPL